MSNKHMVFRAGRKRDIPVQKIREFLRDHGCPPTLAEVPEKRCCGFYSDGEREYPITYRDNSDARDITRDRALELTSLMISLLGNQ